MIDEAQVKNIVRKALDEEHLTGFIKKFEKEHNLFRGSHDKIGLPENLEIHQTIINYIINKIEDDSIALDQIADGTVYGRIVLAALSEGKALLSEAVGDLDDISDGEYAKALATSLDEGKILLSQALGSLDSIANGETYGRVLLADLSGGHILLATCDGDLDDVDDGISYGKILLTDISAGHILLASVEGDLDDVDDGTSYGKVLVTSLSAGKILLSESEGDLDDIAEGTNYGKVAITDISAGHILLATCDGDLDDIGDGTYGKVLSTDINAGHIKLTECEGDLDDIVNGTTYGRVALTDISAGHILLATCDGDLDDVDEGTTYGKVAVTDISAGHIVLATCDGDLDDLGDGETYAKVLATDISAGHILLSEVVGELPVDKFANLPSDENLVGYWSLDDGQGVTAIDGSGNGNDGTLYPTPVPISPCDVTTDWTPSAGGVLSIDTVDKKAGVGSLKNTVAAPIIATQYFTVYNPAGSWDWSAKKHILCWVKSDRASTAFTVARLYIEDTLGNQRWWDLTFSADEWTAVKGLLSTGSGESYEPPDIALIDKVFLYFKAADTTPFYKKIDDLRIDDRPQWVDGVVGKCLDFDGEDDYVRIPKISAYEFINQMTMQAWITSSGTGTQIIIGADSSWGLLYVSGGKAQFEVYKDGVGWVNSGLSSTSINTGAFFYLTGVWDGTDVSIYVNGVKENSTAFGEGSVKSIATDLFIGDFSAGNGYRFDGLIDEPRIYNRALTASEIKALYLYPAGNKGVYGMVQITDISAGHILLASCDGDLDDIDDGTYGKVLSTDISAGHILLTEVDGDLDDLGDGATYGRVALTDLSAGHILLASTDGDLDDIDDGDSYAKILATDISAGHILLASCDGDLDDVAEGSTYGKVAITSISAGKIVVAGFDADALARIFTDGDAQVNVEAWQHSLDATLIDGGKIYAQSITANEILAGTITADEIHANTITADNLSPELKMEWTSMPSTNQRNVNLAEKTTNSISYVKLKEMKINEITGRVNVHFGLLATEGTPKTVYARIYKNGSPIGIEQSTGDTGTWQYFEQAIAVCAVDDLIQIYAKKVGVGEIARVKDMTLRYNRAVSFLVGQILTTGLSTEDQTVYSVTNQDP